LQVISGWKLPREARRNLLERFPPRYEQVVADHVTHRYDAGNVPLRHETSGEIVGEANDGQGVQALVVCIGGTTDRGDGSRYHITWSLGKDRRAVESNDVIKAIAWTAISPAISVELQPEKWQG